MSKITKQTGYSAEQLATELGCTTDQAAAAIRFLGSVDQASLDLAREYLKEISPVETAAIAVQEEQLDPQAELKRANDIAMQAAIKAAATMGNSTKGLFEEVDSELVQLRKERDRQLAPQIARRVFEAENKTLGKSFTGLMEYIAKFDPFKDTELEGVTGVNTLDINAMLLPSGNNSSNS